MKLNIEVDSNTTPVQFSALAGLFNVLAGGMKIVGGYTEGLVGCANQAQTPVPLSGEYVDDGPALTPVGAAAARQEVQVEAPKEEVKVTRRRRTKAEIEADEKVATDNSKVADAEQAAQQSNEAALAEMTETAPTGEVVNTETGEITAGEQDTTPAADTAEAVDADPNEKAFTEGEVQALATLIARSKGPDVVRNKITELGGTRISALTAAQINKLGAYLESQK